MKFILILTFLVVQIFANIGFIESFEADFTQTVTDEKNKALTYKGHIIASKPQYALWKYTSPIQKDIYINAFNVTIIEPEIEQVIIRKLESSFDFFHMIKDAKEIAKNKFIALYKETKFTITTQNKLLKSISYIDEFENNVTIVFTNQKQNIQINPDIFLPKIPIDFDVIRD